MNVRCLTLRSATWLMNHNARVGQTKTLAFGARGQQEGTHAGRLANAQGCWNWFDTRSGRAHGEVAVVWAAPGVAHDRPASKRALEKRERILFPQ